ncbi:MAG TPA: efflux RND transporter periplasmic adaptor subunit [Candidatus Acidoferrales bacterium]|nr:efflux RND transporter periplasmic adaptor subunit [Candidatus Acidoferrales bacterium]
MRWTGMQCASIAAVFLGAIVAAGCSSESGGERVAAAPARPAAVAPAAASAAHAAGMTREIPALLTVEHEVDVVAGRDGLVIDLAVDEGTRVESGGLLARLDPRQVEVQLEQSRADLKISEYNVKYNEAELHANEARLERAQLMFKEGLGSKADLDEAEFKAKGSAYDLESWKANVEKHHAEVHALELELEKTRIRAPFGGVVSRRYVRQGDAVVKGARCFRLSQLSPLLVEFQVPETDSRKPAVDQSVRGTLASDPSHTFEAKITRVSPVVDAASDSYEVTAALVAPSADLKPGMAVRIAWSNPTAPAPRP